MRAFRAFLPLTAFLVVLAGCREEKTGSVVSPREGRTVATVPALPYSISADSVGTLNGTIVVQRSADEKTLVVGIDTAPSNTSLDRLFVLQAEKPLRVGTLAAFAGRIAYGNREVRLIKADRTVLTLGVQSDIKSSAQSVSEPELRGFGLSRRTGSYVLANGELSKADLEKILALSCNKPAPTPFGIGTMDIDPIPPCQAGGVGSSSCSITCLVTYPEYGMQSCSTSCQSGYYACCFCTGGGANSGCGCYRNPRT